MSTETERCDADEGLFFFFLHQQCCWGCVIVRSRGASRIIVRSRGAIIARRAGPLNGAGPCHAPYSGGERGNEARKDAGAPGIQAARASSLLLNPRRRQAGYWYWPPGSISANACQWTCHIPCMSVWSSICHITYHRRRVGARGAILGAELGAGPSCAPRELGAGPSWAGTVLRAARARCGTVSGAELAAGACAGVGGCDGCGDGSFSGSWAAMSGATEREVDRRLAHRQARSWATSRPMDAAMKSPALGRATPVQRCAILPP